MPPPYLSQRTANGFINHMLMSKRGVVSATPTPRFPDSFLPPSLPRSQGDGHDVAARDPGGPPGPAPRHQDGPLHRRRDPGHRPHPRPHRGRPPLLQSNLGRSISVRRIPLSREVTWSRFVLVLGRCVFGGIKIYGISHPTNHWICTDIWRMPSVRMISGFKDFLFCK